MTGICFLAGDNSLPAHTKASSGRKKTKERETSIILLFPSLSLAQ